MQAAADEELDHLGWCEERLGELGSGPSKLRPVWYAGAWAMGVASGILGDKWSLGFIEETERDEVLECDHKEILIFLTKLYEYLNFYHFIGKQKV